MTQRSHAASLQLSRETRERFVAATEPLIAPVARAIGERLTALASQTGNAREMQENRDGFLAFQTHGATWVAQSQAAWRKALASSAIEGSSSNSLSRLELIGDEVVETGILSSRLAQAIQDKASFELNDLRLRIQHLEGTHELDTRDILKPEALAKVLVDQWLATGLSRGLWTKVQEQVQQHMVEPVVKA
ncbi:MAG: DUF1631 family protein, partial [Variovorax sp.]